MTTWFDIVHYTLVGFGVCFALILLLMAWQQVVKIILLAYGNRPGTEVHHTHTEEHEVHHVHHYQYEEEPPSPPNTVSVSKPSPVEHQRVSQTIVEPRAITRIRRP